MRKFFSKITFQILLVFIPIFCTSFVYAQTSETVQFEQTPLFNSVNFIPGDSVSRWIILNNTTEDTHRVILRAVNVVDVGNLKNAVTLQVKQGNDILYNDTFSDLFSHSEIVFPQVPAGSSARFDLIVNFNSLAGNEYQNSQIGFNLQIGFEDTEEFADDTVTISGHHSGSGSVTVGTKKLIISGESINDLLPPEPGTVLVFWNTNLPATSKVIYGLASLGPYVLDLTLENFGYPLGTEEDEEKVLLHNLILEDLIPEQLYNFRVVSRASPPTVSYEHTFVLREDGTIEIDEPRFEQFSNNSDSGGLGVNNKKLGDSLSTTTATTSTSTESSDLFATTFFGSDLFSWRTIGRLIILLFLLIIFLLLWKRDRKDKKKKKQA